MAQEHSIDHTFSPALFMEDIPGLTIPTHVNGNLTEVLGNPYEYPNSQPNPIGDQSIHYIGDNDKYNSATFEEKISDTFYSFPDVVVQPLDGSVYQCEIIPEGFSLYYPCMDNVDPIYIRQVEQNPGIFAPENCHNTDSTVEYVEGFTPYFPYRKNFQPAHIKKTDFMEPGIRPIGNYRNNGSSVEYNPGMLPVCRTIGGGRHRIFSARNPPQKPYIQEHLRGPTNIDKSMERITRKFNKGNFMQEANGPNVGPSGDYRNSGPSGEYNPAMLPVCRSINSGQHRIFAANRIREQIYNPKRHVIQTYKPPFPARERENLAREQNQKQLDKEISEALKVGDNILRIINFCCSQRQMFNTFSQN